MRLNYVRKNLTYEELLGVVKAIVKHDLNRRAEGERNIYSSNNTTTWVIPGLVISVWRHEHHGLSLDQTYKKHNIIHYSL